MSDRYRERRIIVDRDLLETELRKVAQTPCIYLESSVTICPEEWPRSHDAWCYPCSARRLLGEAETETANELSA